MIPLRDTIRSRRFPWITVLLIALNVYVFFVQWTTGPTPEAGIAALAQRYGVVPAAIPPLEMLPQVGIAPYLPLVTAMFLTAACSTCWATCSSSGCSATTWRTASDAAGSWSSTS